MTARGSSTWGSDASLLVTQPGFPEGRVTLPQAPDQKTDASGQLAATPPGQLEFADPNRFGALADLYSQLAISDRVRQRMPEKPMPTEITASALQGASGGVILPVIKLTVSAPTKPGVEALNKHLIDALRGVLSEDQAKNSVPVKQRVELATLNAPTAGYMVKGPSHTASILAFLLCLIGTVAVTHLLAGLRDRGPAEGLAGIVDPWGPDDEEAPAQAESNLPGRKPVSVWSDGPTPFQTEPAPVVPPAPEPAKGRALLGRRSPR
jgi:hypothetical protein